MKMKCMNCGFEWMNDLKLPKTLPEGSVSTGLCKPCALKMEAELDATLAQANAISNAITGDKKL